MDCKDVSAQLPDIVDGKLAEREIRAISEHLADCARCRAELDAMQECWNALAEVPGLEVSPDFAMRVRRRAQRPRRLRRLAIAAGVLFAIAGLFTLHKIVPPASDNGDEIQISQVIDQEQDIDVIADLDVLQDIDVIQSLASSDN